MSLNITTLNNHSAVSKTFAGIGQDRNSSEWINTSDSSDALDVRLVVKNTVAKTSSGETRRILVQCVATAAPLVEDGNKVRQEAITVNLTIACPKISSNGNLSLATKQDAVAYVRNLVTDAVIVQLLRGEV